MRRSSTENPVQPLDVHQLVKQIRSSDPRSQAFASAAIQHLTYKNAKIKDVLRNAGALPPLIRLLYSDQTKVLLGATGALRNLTFGGDLKISMDFDKLGGIRAVAWLMETQQAVENASCLTAASADRLNMVQENCSAILCNLSMLEAMRGPLLRDAVLPSVVEAVVDPTTSASLNALCSHSGPLEGQPCYNSIFFRNICALIRNISSSSDASNRRRLRACPGLLSALLTVLKVAVAAGQANTITVENCVSAVRNLCFALPEINDPDYCCRKRADIDNTAVEPSHNPRPRSSHRRGVDNPKLPESSVPPAAELSQISKLPESLLWHRNTVACLISLLRKTSNPIAIEAAIGALQNLSAGEWPPSEQVRSQVRLLCGLPLIVELLHAPVCAIVSSAASALRNLAVEPETRDLLGKHALPVIVASLPSATDSPSTVIQRPVARTVADHETRFSAARIVPLLLLCLTILRGELSFAQYISCTFSVLSHVAGLRRFVELGGVHRCQYLARVDYPSMRCEESEEIRTSPAHVACHVLHLLWKMKKLRPVLKQRGWKKADFHPKVRALTPLPTSTTRATNRGHGTKRQFSLADDFPPQYAYPFQTDPEDNRQGRYAAAAMAAHQIKTIPVRARNVEQECPLHPPPASDARPRRSFRKQRRPLT